MKPILIFCLVHFKRGIHQAFAQFERSTAMLRLADESNENNVRMIMERQKKVRHLMLFHPLIMIPLPLPPVRTRVEL